MLEERARLGDVSLMGLTAMLAEFGKHTTRVVDESRRSFSTASKCVKEAVVDLGKGNSGSTLAMSAAGCGGASAYRRTAGDALQRPYGHRSGVRRWLIPGARWLTDTAVCHRRESHLWKSSGRN